MINDDYGACETRLKQRADMPRREEASVVLIAMVLCIIPTHVVALAERSDIAQVFVCFGLRDDCWVSFVRRVSSVKSSLPVIEANKSLVTFSGSMPNV